ncbi:hypothetical protein [Nocardia brasiliensis]|uniref:hypothetical protein n=1 Tax=Nocardia brasiliensis TaxID=37326 RepID=UPI001896307D|nr:hypothetical protein [Nocardia brasiliensis]MBF6541971.1 hypothetical protein [Nocardia brasiliensis]
MFTIQLGAAERHVPEGETGLPMTLQADLEKLGVKSNQMYGLGDEAARLEVADGMLPLLSWGEKLRAVEEAKGLAGDVEDRLITAVAGRLREIGRLMHQATIKFREAEADNAAEILAATYTKDSGEWGAPR